VCQGHECWPSEFPGSSSGTAPLIRESASAGTLEDEDTVLSRNVRISLPIDVAPYPVKAESSSTNLLSDRKHTSCPLQIIFVIRYVEIKSVFNTRIRRLSEFGSAVH
jgi:hypothetical protein